VLLSEEQVGDAAALARAYRDVLGSAEIYVADLDAIAGAPWPSEARSAIYAVGVPTMVDAGVTTPSDAQAALSAGASRVVVGLETLTSFEELGRIVHTISAARVVFSVDCRGSRALVRSDADLARVTPLDAARLAVDAGVRAVLLLDLARVGQADGPNLALTEAVRSALPETELLAGGGIRDDGDLQRLAAAGCDGALVGTAAHEGRISPSPLLFPPSTCRKKEPDRAGPF
jgi:phosphoribosylformimino-5-aminoimidazole carboxamide ribotide isomerase